MRKRDREAVSGNELSLFYKGSCGVSCTEVGHRNQHKWLVRTIQTYFQGATWQRCQTHFTCNILDACPETLQGGLRGKLRLVFETPDMATARRLLEQMRASKAT